MRSDPLPLIAPRRAAGRLLRLLVAALLGLLVLPRSAHAAGTVSLSTREPVEVDGKWKMNMTIDYGSVPPLPHIPMLFIFTPTTLYERALTDKTGDKPVLNKIPLQNQQTINESIDVGFSDASGKVFKVTKFDFAIRRDHGFEAGEYDLQIKRSDDGVQMGPTIKLVLKGDNVVIDRRAITFAGEKKSKKKDDSGDSGDAKKAEQAKAEAPSESTAETPPEDASGPPPVPPKQGGCGCRLGGDSGPDGVGAALAVAGLGAALTARRRARRAA
jgi:MYXO-CTERM domain-containing protein